MTLFEISVCLFGCLVFYLYGEYIVHRSFRKEKKEEENYNKNNKNKKVCTHWK